jgi:hypothetical protein
MGTERKGRPRVIQGKAQPEPLSAFLSPHHLTEVPPKGPQSLC